MKIISQLCLALLPVLAELAKSAEMMLARGIIVGHQTVRQWCANFGQTHANGLRRHRPHPGGTWHFDKIFITINGKRHSLWRAVDQHGNVLDILLTFRRDTTAATRFFPKLLTDLPYVPRVLVTDKLASYHTAREAGFCGRSSTVHRRI
jgi:putative transposase